MQTTIDRKSTYKTAIPRKTLRDRKMTFRMSEEFQTILGLIAGKENTTLTNVIEFAVRDFATRNGLLTADGVTRRYLKSGASLTNDERGEYRVGGEG